MFNARVCVLPCNIQIACGDQPNIEAGASSVGDHFSQPTWENSPMPLLTFFIAFAVALVAVDSPAKADTLAGSWSGSGSVQYSQTRERAKCRASYSRVSGTLYRMNASCATASGRVDQTATLNRVGDGEYAGSFHNSQFNVTGSIRVKLSGNAQFVRLSGNGGGSGSFKLRKR